MLIAVTGCGESPSSSPAATEPDVAGCPADSEAVLNASALADVDLDGDGKAETVRQIAADAGPCANTLVTTVANKQVWAKGDALPTTKARAVTIGDLDYLLTQSTHPRGGFQTRLLGYAEGKFTELTLDGQPVFPFVATDTNTGFLSAACDGPDLQVTTALVTNHMRWDVWRETLAINGTAVASKEREKLASGLRAGQVAKRYPDLGKHTILTNCG